MFCLVESEEERPRVSFAEDATASGKKRAVEEVSQEKGSKKKKQKKGKK